MESCSLSYFKWFDLVGNIILIWQRWSHWITLGSVHVSECVVIQLTIRSSMRKETNCLPTTKARIECCALHMCGSLFNGMQSTDQMPFHLFGSFTLAIRECIQFQSIYSHKFAGMYGNSWWRRRRWRIGWWCHTISFVRTSMFLRAAVFQSDICFIRGKA